ncbi:MULTISPECIES: DUF934 domain-containing protein [unclassified Roseitalea]|uniref:DUF934 domain-containing protein n=1 Tax=unclassified Roseitalea TaxID=2639107 RepID=UPI00273E2BCB|nr:MULTISPECIES: DUF934 domain-containing protein [unclassified Roseitalea]
MAETGTTMVIVTDAGFAPDDRAGALMAGTYGEVSLDDLRAGLPEDRPPRIGLNLAADADARAVAPHFNWLDAITISFESFADGRGFSLATQLRRLGFDGRLIAQGHVIADQYAHARRCGFDAVAIDARLAARQPEGQWTAQVSRIDVTYQNRLRQAPIVA